MSLEKSMSWQHVVWNYDVVFVYENKSLFHYFIEEDHLRDINIKGNYDLRQFVF